jgi:hypothetical protein
MALSNRWLRSGVFARVTARRWALSARKLADPTEHCLATREFPAGAVAVARRSAGLGTHRGVLPHGVRRPFGVELRICVIRGISLGPRQ